jgi:antitoxin MazE
MQVERWGDSLIIRLPANIVAQLDLHEHDEVLVEARAWQKIVPRDRAREDAYHRLLNLNWALAPGFVFSRSEPCSDGA